MIDSTIHASIVESLDSWDREAVRKRAEEAEALRLQFGERFPVAAWPQLALNEYALGQSGQDTVSWWIEYKTKPISSMSGGSAHKHLIFRSTNGTWRFPKEYESVDQAWEAIRSGFVQMLGSAENGQFDDTDDIKVRLRPAEWCTSWNLIVRSGVS